jgi:REP element-mobilizing transposase RayT
MTPHRARPPHSASQPVHVTLRALFRPLRSEHVLPTLRRAMARANWRAPDSFRILNYTVQYDHVHLIVEAQSKGTLASGMRSLAIRIARNVNALVGRRGRFWADRWYGRALTTPRQVRTALVYVLANFRKHARRALPPGIDPFSSGAWFDGWRGGMAAAKRCLAWPLAVFRRAPPEQAREPVGSGRRSFLEGAQASGPCLPDEVPVSRPKKWLARVGWRRYGLIGLSEAPRGAPK